MHLWFLFPQGHNIFKLRIESVISFYFCACSNVRYIVIDLTLDGQMAEWVLIVQGKRWWWGVSVAKLSGWGKGLDLSDQQ